MLKLERIKYTVDIYHFCMALNVLTVIVFFFFLMDSHTLCIQVSGMTLVKTYQVSGFRVIRMPPHFCESDLFPRINATAKTYSIQTLCHVTFYASETEVF
jgi:hypothetical protein